MPTTKQRRTAKSNIRKAQSTWQSMSPQQRARAQPEGRSRAKPGAKGEGDYYHIVVRGKEQFATFRTQDVGKKGHIQRVAGKRSSGSWDTVKWLISKDDAHIEKKKLIPDTKDAEKVIEQLGSEPIKQRGDIFQAKPRENVPERKKPTAAQKKARAANIKKAQAVRKKSEN